MSVAVQQPQHLQALAVANKIRLDRAKLKRKIDAGEITDAEVLLHPAAQTMTVLEFITAHHRWGRSRALRLLRSAGIYERRALAALTDRQRFELLGRLAG